MTSVLEGKMGVWLCMDYTQTLLNYILPQPHYVLQMNSQTWEGEEGEGGREGRGGGGGGQKEKGGCCSGWEFGEGDEGGGEGRRNVYLC